SDHALELGPRAQTIGHIRIFAPAYGAPEQFDDTVGKVGPASDVYSFALIFLEALRDDAVRAGEHIGEFAMTALDPSRKRPSRALNQTVRMATSSAPPPVNVPPVQSGASALGATPLTSTLMMDNVQRVLTPVPPTTRTGEVPLDASPMAHSLAYSGSPVPP